MTVQEEERSLREDSTAGPPSESASLISTNIDSFHSASEGQSAILKPASKNDIQRLSEPSDREDLSESSVPLNQQQREVLELVMGGTSVFFTGSAGTGKSYLLKVIIKQLQRALKEVAVTASTGIAAIGIGGRTVHSWTGVGLGLEDAKTLGENMLQRNQRQSLERWRKADVLIIDEISMIDGRFFDKLEYVARVTRQRSEPFGGIQLILVGDFFQLPPVPEDGLAVFAFNALTWDVCVPKIITLKQVFRQKDDAFVRVLDQMRRGQLDKQARRILFSLKRQIHYEDDIYSELYPTKDKVEAANDERLDDLPGPPHEFQAQDIPGVDDNQRLVTPERCDRLLKDCRAVKKLPLKVGAVVMLTQNLTNGKLVNGSLGKVVGFQSVKEASGDKNIEVAEFEETEPKETIGGNKKKKARLEQSNTSTLVHSSKMYNAFGVKQGKWDIQLNSFRDPSKMPSSEDRRLWPLVQFVSGEKMLMPPVDFQVQRFTNGRLITEATRRQVPLILAWAMSIHKSQGQTLSRVKIDLARSFEKGQTYVAVSRCTSLETLQIINFLPSKVKAHQSVIDWNSQYTISSLSRAQGKDDDDSKSGDDDKVEKKDDEHDWKGTVVNLGGRPGEEMIIRF